MFIDVIMKYQDEKRLKMVGISAELVVTCITSLEVQSPVSLLYLPVEMHGIFRNYFYAFIQMILCNAAVNALVEHLY